MKTLKICMAAIALIFGSAALNAQEYQTKNDISISWGGGLTSEIVSSFEDLISMDALATIGTNYKTSNVKSLGAIGVEYTYHVNQLVAVGGIAAFSHSTRDLTVDGTAQGKMKNNNFTVMPVVKFDWLRRSHFGMYSKFAAGVTFRSEKNSTINYSESEAHFNWQASLLGVEAGGRSVRGFFEAGFGEQGAVLAGIRYKF